MSYPRTIVVENERLKNLLVEKRDLINSGRDKSVRVEELEIEMQKIDEEIQAIEKEVNVDDLNARAAEVTKRFNSVTKEMEDVKQQLYERVRSRVPKELIKKYEDAKKRKEEMEIERNKIALKAQKYNDRIIPLARKAMKPFLENEYEDFESLQLENGKVVGTIFSHMEEFKKRFFDKK